MASSSQPTGQDKAKALVESIGRKLGNLGERYYARMDPELRRAVQDMVSSLHETTGATVMTCD